MVRVMQPAHLDDVKALLDICFGESAWSAESVRSQLENPVSRCVVAVEDDRLVGYLAFEQVSDEGSIVEIAVHPAYRRRGIAREMLTSVTNDNSLKEIFLEVRESNAPAIALYQSLGFEEIAVRRGYYDHPKENAVVMKKECVYENTCNRKQL